jgi:hypothetical protein
VRLYMMRLGHGRPDSGLSVPSEVGGPETGRLAVLLRAGAVQAALA